MMIALKRDLFTIDELLRITGGRLIHGGDASIAVNNIQIDSRKCGPGSLFIPLKGENTDGHVFISDAFSRGALVSLAGKKSWNEDISGKTAGRTCILVDDPLKGMQNLAKSHIRRMLSLTNIGITGSTGKTTAKELIGQTVQEAGSSFISEGNLNSDIGVCLSAFSVDSSVLYGVFELGMNRIGEIQEITDIIRPDIAVITNIGTAHIGLLGSKHEIMKEKKKIFSFFTGKETGFVYEDEPFFKELTEDVRGRIIPFGPKSLKGFQDYELQGIDGIIFRWAGERVAVPLLGEQNVPYLCAAVEIGRVLGLSDHDIARGMGGVKPLFGRGQIRRGEVTLICDYYNANPESMEKALNFLKTVESRGRKAAVLGSMKELGSFSREAHRQIGKNVLDSGIDYVFLFGDEMRDAYEVCRGRGMENVFWTADKGQLKKVLSEFIQEGDTVLLKGSRTTALEEMEEYIV